MRTIPFDRRRFVLGMLSAPFAGALAAPAQTSGDRLAPWTPGCLDIHHIASGRGNATLVLMPDGRSLLIDAGASADGLDVSAAPRPDASRRAGEWIGRYVQRQLRATGRSGLDTLLVTHLHPDHTGDVTDASPLSKRGQYRLSGVTDVAEIVPVATLVDRGFPNYDYPAAPRGRFAENYLAFIAARVKRGERVERFVPGSASQLGAPMDLFSIRNIAANGYVWTGAGTHTQTRFPPLASLASADYPTENMCSIALRLGYGQFAYFTGGDLTSYSWDGDAPWRDVLGPAARAAGPVDVATADHHGMFDGLSADVVRALRPQAWVIPSWHISHPDQLQLERMLSTRLYPGVHDVFATSVMRGNVLANGRLLKQLRSLDGHVVVRVAPGGATYAITVTHNTDELDRVKLVTDPYASRAGLSASGV